MGSYHISFSFNIATEMGGPFWSQARLEKTWPQAVSTFSKMRSLVLIGNH